MDKFLVCECRFDNRWSTEWTNCSRTAAKKVAPLMFGRGTETPGSRTGLTSWSNSSDSEQVNAWKTFGR